MTVSAKELLAAIPLYTDGQLYRVLHLPPSAAMAAAGVLAQMREPFSALIVDKDEVTLVIAEDLLEEYARRLKEREVSEPYRLITFDGALEPTLIGFIAAISKALADAGVPILPLAAFQRDHILVPAAQFEAAWSALQTLQQRS